jgi:alpha-glucosidase
VASDVTGTAADTTIASPDQTVQLALSSQGGSLAWAVSLDGRPVIEPSRLGMVVDGVDLVRGASIGEVERYDVDERFRWWGGRSEAAARCRGARLALTHAGTGTRFTLDVRVFDDAAAFRFVVPGEGRRVPDAASEFRLPAGSVVWRHGLRDHYEGLHVRTALEDLAAGEWAAPPVTARLPDSGYAAITEAGLEGYGGLVLQADGQGALLERLGHAPPASYPFLLRYGEEEAARLALPAAVDGPIATPWRVVLAGRDLHTLVASSVVPGLCRPPDERLFPDGADTPWLRPGRAVWRYLDGGDGGVSGLREFSRLAGELGFEHHVVEGEWQQWSEAEVRRLVDSSREHGVGIWLWLHSKDHREPEARRRLFARLRGLGVAGLKVDFFDHEAKEVIDLYHDVLRDAAEVELMVNFHGANKPAGEARTWPNEMTREAVRGLEHRRTEAWAVHNTTLPFTRFLAGPADYTPVVFGERRRDTSWAHQVATAIVFTSPVLVYGGHPASLLASPAVDVIRSVPSVWDETVVLPESAVGELAAYARRSGARWFLGVLNGPGARTLRVPLSFLPAGAHRAVLVSDRPGEDGALDVEERDTSASEVLEVPLRPGGGFVGRFSP